MGSSVKCTPYRCEVVATCFADSVSGWQIMAIGIELPQRVGRSPPGASLAEIGVFAISCDASGQTSFGLKIRLVATKKIEVLSLPLGMLSQNALDGSLMDRK